MVGAAKPFIGSCATPGRVGGEVPAPRFPSSLLRDAATSRRNATVELARSCRRQAAAAAADNLKNTIVERLAPQFEGREKEIAAHIARSPSWFGSGS